MKKVLLLAPLACVPLLLAVPAHAQVRGKTLIKFSMPQGADPTDKLTYTDPGAFYVKTDGTHPGDQQGTNITGSVLVDGLEVHGAVPDTHSPGFIPIRTVDIFTNFTGPLDFSIDAGFGFTPWGMRTLTGSALNGFFQGFEFYQVKGSGALSDDAFHAILSADISNLNASDQQAFNDAGFTSIGKTTSSVPEASSVALFGLVAGGGLLALRRRRTTVSAN